MFEVVPKLVGQSGAKDLIRRLHRLKRNWPSEPELHDLDPRTIEALLEYIAEQEKERPQICWFAAILLGAFAVLMVPVALEATCILIGLLLLIIGVFHFDPGPALRIASYALTQTDDMRVLSALIQTTRFPWGKHEQILGAIKRLLEQVTEEHTGLLSDAVQQRVWKLAVEPVLTPQRYDTELALGTLRAIGHIGNSTMLMEMRRLANQSVWDEPQSQFVAIARELVPLMRARLKRQEVPQTLLRASCPPASPSDVLLRAAYATKPEPASQLLRAATSEDREA